MTLSVSADRGRPGRRLCPPVLSFFRVLLRGGLCPAPFSSVLRPAVSLRAHPSRGDVRRALLEACGIVLAFVLRRRAQAGGDPRPPTPAARVWTPGGGTVSLTRVLGRGTSWAGD